MMEENLEMQRSGPKTRNDNKILSLFDTKRKSVAVAPKKEYLRCKLIRGHKRAIRQILSNTIPTTTIHKFNFTDLKSHTLWTLIIKVINRNPELFETISKTEAGPVTDGRTKRDKGNSNLTERSFNSAFCKVYFSDPDIRESFFQYVNLIFVDFDPSVLCKKFDFYCCRQEKHNTYCLEKWGQLYRYITLDMIKELSVDPFFAYNQNVRLPDFRNFENFEVDEFFESEDKRIDTSI